ncbi:ribosome biogenesis protein Nop53/GLTSCR2 [Exophiala viscosa]|uniref:Ribosome biogenesis protein NOP53 n=1 Tax=Exophiala viscosa TaxID=2486360 RepID=A0AAN6DYR8_9EURO|nr:ribosome biogenesis protein Nop53/GLTSCR2 [Exophiala viscosa]KAI1623988.1 ribosome biogenesis protein Nop53/GLTSCR2 [Exophiala viscosa]
MPSEIGAPQQHKQPSRKGKKAWRKNVDITQVQEGLENLREEIIQGGPVAEKASEELFALDTTGSTDIAKKYKLQKPLKVDEILSRRSAVPGLGSRKRPHGAITDGVLEITNKRQKPDWVSKKEVQRLRNNINTTSFLDNEKIDGDGTGFDIWGVDSVPKTQEEQASVLEYVPKAKAKVAPPTIRKAPIAMTADGQPVRAVQPPKAGASYNPTFEDWDDLLNEEGEREVEAEKIRLRQAQIEAEKQARIQELAALPEPNPADEESAWEGFETDNDDAQMLKRKRPERKTATQRNKIKRRKEAERQAKHEKRMGDKQKQVEQMISALIKRQEHETALAMKGADDEETQEGNDRVLRRRKMGNSVIPERRLEVVLPDELQESLRRLKPEGNLLNDRFRTLLVNGKLEARKPVLQPKKAKREYTEKWTYKDFSVKV